MKIQDSATSHSSLLHFHVCVHCERPYFDLYVLFSSVKRSVQKAYNVDISTYRAWTRTHTWPRNTTLTTVILATKCRLDAT